MQLFIEDLSFEKSSLIYIIRSKSGKMFVIYFFMSSKSGIKRLDWSHEKIMGKKLHA